MTSKTAVKAWGTLAIAVLTVGYGNDAGHASTPEKAEATYTLMQDGKVEELRAMLEEDPALANTDHWEDESLLNIVIDTRPAFPNMFATIRVLLEAGADPNMHAPQLLRKAIWRGEPEVYELLLEHGADPTVVWTRKKMNMLEYSRSYGDERFDEITNAWEMEYQ